MFGGTLQYRHLIPAPVDWTSECQCQVLQTHMDNMSKTKPRTSMTHVHVACESKLRSVVRSGTCGRIHAQKYGWQTVHAVVYHARAAHAFSEGITCRHCISAKEYNLPFAYCDLSNIF